MNQIKYRSTQNTKQETTHKKAKEKSCKTKKLDNKYRKTQKKRPDREQVQYTYKVHKMLKDQPGKKKKTQR